MILNKAGNSSDKAKYRPIALVTACSKIFELCLLIMLEKYLHTHDQQFGFKSQHATYMCIFTVKSVIKYYTKQNSTAFTCFLDAAKAFDRVSHWTLCGNVRHRHGCHPGVPPYSLGIKIMDNPRTPGPCLCATIILHSSPYAQPIHIQSTLTS